MEVTARQKVQLAEDAWNTRDPDLVGLAYEYESRDVHGQWWRSHGNEHCESTERRLTLDDASSRVVPR
jgi:nuclear transport factor 2 (NTF2) superfamily protein